MEQDTGKFRKNTKDQYYTKSSIAKQCISKLIEIYPDSTSYTWIEPSAGNGVFLKLVPSSIKTIGLDIDPKGHNIQKANFLEWTPCINETKYLVFGNPPFGRQGSTAKAFIKHSAVIGNIIAFILPRSFVKPSMSRAFPPEFHCLYQEELEKDSFEVNGDPYDVPCIFQIWEKQRIARTISIPIREEGFKYVKYDEPYDIAFKRVGGKAGTTYRSNDTCIYNRNFHYFLKLDYKYVSFITQIIDATNMHIFPSNTVGPRSLSKSEANEVLNTILKSFIL
jgi:hypothetical protein